MRWVSEKLWWGDLTMIDKVRYAFAALAAIVCVCALAACNPTPIYTPAPTNQLPVSADSQDADTAEEIFNAVDMSDGELMDYLLSKVPKAYEMVTGNGLIPLVTGETTELEGVCRDVWLGTDLDEKFTREILYTISASGRIYEYDPLEDVWEIRNEGSLSKLAYVKLGKVIGDGQVQFLIDEVRWIDDASMPNGYAIENETEDWVPYTATLWTECSIWVNVPDVGMERHSISLDNFIEQLGGRQGMLLADITVDHEGGLLSVSERNTP